MKQLHAICQVQQAGQALSEEQRSWLKDMLEIMERWGSGGPPRSYSGWYPSLFYHENSPIWTANIPRLTGIPRRRTHTVFPDDPSGDAGGILHEGIESIAMMFLSIDCQDPETGQPVLRTYAGPIYTHYEFLRPSGERMTDEAWESEIAEVAPPYPNGPRAPAPSYHRVDPLSFYHCNCMSFFLMPPYEAVWRVCIHPRACLDPGVASSLHVGGWLGLLFRTALPAKALRPRAAAPVIRTTAPSVTPQIVTWVAPPCRALNKETVAGLVGRA